MLRNQVAKRAVTLRLAGSVAQALVFAATGQLQAGIIVHTNDFIDNANRTGFMGFESLSATTTGIPTYSEGGLRIDQINGDGNDIWTTFLPPEGNRSWYPFQGDLGYTRLTLQNGSDFESIGFLLKSGWPGSHTITVLYALLEAGVVVQSGTLPGVSYDGGPPAGMYLGFSGGGFDEVWLRDGTTSSLSFNDGTINALSIDSIETAGPSDEITSTPEPSTLLILAGALLAGAVAGLRRQGARG